MDENIKSISFAEAETHRRVTFRDLYDAEVRKPTPRQSFVKACAEATGMSELTVKAWAMGTQIPGPAARKLLSAHLGVDAGELFPVK